MTTLLAGAPLRRIVFALAAAGKVRVRESGDLLAVARPAGSAHPGTYLLRHDTGQWGPYRRDVPVEETPLPESGVYRLVHRLGLSLADVADAIDRP